MRAPPITHRDYVAASGAQAAQAPQQAVPQAPQQMYQVLATPGQRIELWRGWRRVAYTGTRFTVPPNPYDRGVWANLAEVWRVPGGDKLD